jgi:hypothetical protein
MDVRVVLWTWETEASFRPPFIASASLGTMPTLTRTQLAQRPEELYQPLFSETQTKPKPHPKQKKGKKTQQTFDEDQIEASQPLLADPLNMYPQDHHNQAMAQQTLNNALTM